MKKMVHLISGIKISKMALEDNFLRLDAEYGLSEIIKRTADGDFTYSEIEEIFQQGLISAEEYEYCLEISERNKNG